MGMLDPGQPVILVVLGVVSAGAAVARSWIGHRTAVDLEKERTRRVLGTLVRAPRRECAEVVRACAEFEAAAGVNVAAVAGAPLSCELFAKLSRCGLGRRPVDRDHECRCHGALTGRRGGTPAPGA